MSIEATSWAWWAIEEHKLPPAQLAVLLCLANCHTPVNGCFPSQDYMVRKCNISRSSLNNQLGVLEGLKLLRREVTLNPKTRVKENTRYYLAFDDPKRAVDNAQTHVQNLDMENPDRTRETHVQNLDMEKGASHVQTHVQTHVQNLDMNHKDYNINKKPRRGARDGEPAAPLPRWSGDPRIRDRVANDPRYGEAFAVSYLDLAALPADDGSVVARNGYAYGKLRACEALRGVEVHPPG